MFLPLQALAIISLTLTLTVFSCSQDYECNYNGICTDGNCICDVGWLNWDCGQLNLTTAHRANGYDLTAEGTYSWGGQVIRDPKNSSKYHLFAEEMSNGCDLEYWSPYSRIIRAEASSPNGPFTFAAEVVSTFAHNPSVVYSSYRNLYLLYHIGCPQGPFNDCQRVSITCGPGNDLNGESGVSLLTSPNLIDWTNQGMVINGSDGWQADLTNPSVWPVEYSRSNEMVVIYRGCPYDGGEEKIGLAHSLDDGQSGYFEDPNPLFDNHAEDPFVWRDKRGHYHLLVHAMGDGGGNTGQTMQGRHAYAECWNCPWTYNNSTVAYNTTVVFEDGTLTYYARERPSLFFSDDDTMTPLYLVNGVKETSSPYSYTLIQPVGVEKVG